LVRTRRERCGTCSKTAAVSTLHFANSTATGHRRPRLRNPAPDRLTGALSTRSGGVSKGLTRQRRSRLGAGPGLADHELFYRVDIPPVRQRAAGLGKRIVHCAEPRLVGGDYAVQQGQLVWVGCQRVVAVEVDITEVLGQPLQVFGADANVASQSVDV